MREIILSILLLMTLSLSAQEMGVTKKFFTTENFRVGAIIGADRSWAGDEGQTKMMTSLGTIDNENILYEKAASTTFFLGLDLYSQTSTLGFMTGVGVNFQEYSVKDISGNARDSISTTNLEIPLYVRLRIGNALGRSQFWLAGGAGYNFTSKARNVSINSNNQIGSTIDVKNQFKAIPYLSGIIGYEFMGGSEKLEELNRDTFRFLLYAKVNYDLDNRLTFDANSGQNILQSYPNPSLEFLRISLGLKLMLRLSKATEIIGDSLKQ